MKSAGLLRICDDFGRIQELIFVDQGECMLLVGLVLDELSRTL